MSSGIDWKYTAIYKVIKAIEDYSVAYKDNIENSTELASLCLKAYQDHLKEQGLTIVPIEPTEEMIQAALDCADENKNPENRMIGLSGIYKVMIGGESG